MTRQNRFIVITAIVAVTALGLAAALYFTFGGYRAPSVTAVNEARSFSPADISGLDVRTSSTDVRVTPSETGQIEVTLTGTVRADNPAAIPTLELYTGDGVLNVRLNRTGGRKFTIGFASMNLILEIAVPAAILNPMVIATSSADITVTGLALEGVQIGTSSGTVDFRSIKSVTGQSVFDSSSGDINLDIAKLDGDLQLETSSGDVTISLPADAGLELAAETSSGDIAVDFPVAASGNLHNRGKASGTIGAGSHELSVNTSSGDIRVRRR